MATSYQYPTTTEITAVENTTISTTVDNNYNMISNQSPVQSSKFRGWLKATKDILAWLKDDAENEITPTLLNSWVQFGLGFKELKYYKDKFNRVHISGMIKNGTSTLGTVLFTLPVGYRPSQEILIPASAYFGTGTNDVFGAVRVQSTGNVTLHTAGAQFICINFSFRV